MSFALLVFVLAVAGCIYSYVGYPAVLLVLGWLGAGRRPAAERREAGRRPAAGRREAARRRSGAGPEPTVTVIIAAYNEAGNIVGKLRNTLALDYPPERLQVVVASDGSTDGTEEAVAALRHPRVELLRLPRRGKLAALNDAVAHARGEILVCTDANVTIDPAAIRRLVRHFVDPAVGGVAGQKRLRGSGTPGLVRSARAVAAGGPGSGDSTGEGEGLYVRFDSWVKRLESRLGNVYGADGALYAIRRALYVPLRELAQADDLAISARVVLQGSRLVYEPDALCWEEAPADGRLELRRKVRVANHTLRAVLLMSPALRHAPLYALQLASHKLARYLVPVWLLGVLLSSAVLAGSHAAFANLLLLQVGFYALAIGGWILRSHPSGRLRLLTVPFYFSLVNTAALLALLELLQRRRHVVWVPRGGLG